MAGVRLGAGVLIALAAGSAVAGWWLLGGIVLAGLLARCSARAVPVPTGKAAWLLSGTRIATQVACVALFASAFGVYLVPGHATLAAVLVILVVTVADAVGVPLPSYARGWIVGLLLVATGVLIALCVAISPASPVTTEASSAWGILPAAAVMSPLLRGHGAWWIGGSVAVALAVAAAALYQLGPIRLGLSNAPLRDVLAAADGQALEPWLAAAVVLATVPAALSALSEARDELGEDVPGTVACGLAAALVSLTGPLTALSLAAVFALAEVLVINSLAGTRR